jgi:hypothetical protein
MTAVAAAPVGVGSAKRRAALADHGRPPAAKSAREWTFRMRTRP